MTNHIAHSLAARTGISTSLVETYLRDGLTPNEILTCAGVNAVQTHIDAFDLAIRHKARIELRGTSARPISEFALSDGSTVIIEHDQPRNAVVTIGDAGGYVRIEADGARRMQSNPCARWPVIQHLGTMRRTKRLTVLGTLIL